METFLIILRSLILLITIIITPDMTVRDTIIWTLCVCIYGIITFLETKLKSK